MGRATDIEIHAREAWACARRLDESWPSTAGKSSKKSSTTGARLLDAQESLAYGIIDKILEHR